MIINCSQLTTCNTLREGETVRLDFLDESHNAVSLLLPFESAESIAMTLPQLLTQAVRAQTRQDNARYVFPLGRWLLEGVGDRQSLILTLATVDGFEVSFRIPHAAGRALGWALQHESDDDTADLGDPPVGTGKSEIN